MRHAPFRLNRSGIMLAIVSAAFAHEAGAAAGRAEFTIGGVTVARAGVERPLARGTELDNGDTVRTNGGRAQIRFTDGAYVSLQPNTEYSIKDYRYGGSAQGEERGFFSLLKGAMRTVTGAIGRINRDRYQIATPTATVGIRGTGGVIQVQDDGSTLVIGTSGIWSLTNPSGSVDVPGGTSAVAPSDPNQPPQETTQQPTSGPAPVQEQEPVFVAGEQVDEQGLPVVPETPETPQPSFVPLVTGEPYTFAVAYGEDNDGIFGDLDGGEGSFVVFNPSGQATEINSSYVLQSGSQTDFGSDGILAWGRWTGAMAQVEGPPLTTLHYVVGIPTADMPTTGTATYTVIGFTTPTFVDGTGSGTFTGSLDVDFESPSRVTANIGVGIGGQSYAFSGQTSVARQWSMSGLLPTQSSGCQSSSCTANIEGFFAGAAASRAGMSYLIRDLSGQISREIVGAAALQRGALAPSPPR